MAISEQSRHDLHDRLAEVLGRGNAATLMEHLPPRGWADVATKHDLAAHAVATKRDLEALAVATRRDLEALAVATRRDLEAHAVATKRDLEALAVATKRDLEALAVATRRDLEALEARLTTRLDVSEQRMRADMHEAIAHALTSQTRTILFGLVGSNLTVVALILGTLGLR